MGITPRSRSCWAPLDHRNAPRLPPLVSILCPRQGTFPYPTRIRCLLQDQAARFGECTSDSGRHVYSEHGCTVCMLAAVGNKHAKGRDRASRRAARSLNRAPRGTYVPPPPSECDPAPPPIPVYLGNGTSRLIAELRHKDGRLVHYALVHEAIDDNGVWREVSKIDCCHSQVHRHTADVDHPEKDRRKVIRELFTQKDVADSWDDSYTDILTNWEEQERSWRRGKAKGGRK